MQATDPVAIPYAEALVELAREREALAAVREQVAALVEAFVQEPDTLLVLESPRIDEDAKIGIIDRALRGSLEDVLCDFLCVVIRHDRSIHIRAICEESVRQLDLALGRLAAVVQTARKLSDEDAAAIEQALEQLTGQDVVMDVQVRAELIGGTRIRMGDQVVDATVRTRLREMRRRLDAVRMPAGVFEGEPAPPRGGKDKS